MRNKLLNSFSVGTPDQWNHVLEVLNIPENAIILPMQMTNRTKD